MFSHVIAALALLASAASAKSCTNFTIPVTISARNGVFDNLPIPITNRDATAFALAGTRQGENGTNEALTGYATVSGTYNISAKLCTPTEWRSIPPLQILTHGIGFDKAYWDLSFHNYNYSYIDTALAAGYHTLSYDRLGIGESSHGDPRDEIETILEVAALAAITNMARNGSLPGFSTAYSKTVHVGHSLGALETYTLAALYPTITDAIVLTGFSLNTTFLPLLIAGFNFQQAYLNQPLRFGPSSTLNYPPGYLTNSNAGTFNYAYFHNYNFDPSILFYAEANKQPVTIGEALTLLSIPVPCPFAGPVLVFTGEYDLPFCGGDCLNTGGAGSSIPAMSVGAFPDANPFDTIIQPDTGHGLNLHFNATAGYVAIQNFLASNGLPGN